jgi:hypothetical protein
VRHHSAAVEPSARERHRRWVRTTFVLGVVGAASCTVYDTKLLEEAKGVGGTTGSGASGGDGSGASGGASGGDAGSGAAGGKGGGGMSATGGTAGGGTAGTAAGKGGAGGASGASGGKAGSAGTAGKGGSGGTPNAGTAGTMDGGEGGEIVDPCPGGDCCPNSTKTMPGVCGCDVADTDTDADLTPDCMDLCAADDTRTMPGMCGCGSTYAEADCASLRMPLVNRYSFNGSGTVIEDSVGDADGTLTQLMTGATQANGVVTLTGGVSAANDMNKAYVALPSGCLTGLTNATFEAWVTWSMTCTGTCSNNWQRVFDFGVASTGTTGSNIFLTPRSSNTGNTVFSASTTTGANNEIATGYRADNASITAGAHHFAVVVDDTADQVRLYIDGVLAVPVVAANTGAYVGTLASITATNCWLGRSNYASDAYFNGTFDEFRIYDTALPLSAITFSIAAGPNAPFLP